MSENPYDRTPYGQHCHRQTHPERLATSGTLFGMQPPDPRKARILELGCASGTNLIPMAFNLPQATFRGIDLSRRQIDTGRREVARLGLRNIELEHRSILDVEEDGETFDYIICHGVYSWVGDDVRRKILTLCAALLSPHGVAHVSYNTLPGWHMVRTVRDMMRYHARAFDEPLEQAQQARALLGFMTRSWEGQDSPYAAFLRSESELLADVDDSYLLHDHLAEVNRPIYFHEFIDSAREVGLQYLADSSLASMLPENLPQEVYEKLREIKDIVRQEQYMDFVRGRRFRNTLLCRVDIKLNRELHAKGLQSFFVESACRPERDLQPHHMEQGVEVTFRSGESTLRVSGRTGKTALARLFARSRWPVTYDELIDDVSEEIGESVQVVGERLERELDPARLIFSSALEISSLPPQWVVEISERPALASLARYQARRYGRATNQRHQIVNLGPADRLIAERLDGTQTVDEVASVVAERVRRGDLKLSIDGRPGAESPELDELVRAYCAGVVERFRDSALLVA